MGATVATSVFVRAFDNMWFLPSPVNGGRRKPPCGAGWTAAGLAASLLAGCGAGESTSPPPAAPPPPPPPAIGSAGDGTLATVLEWVRGQYGLPGLAGFTIRGAELVEMGAAGVRAVGFNPAATTADRWHVGSLTKAMTATVAAVLVERGQIDWSTRIADVLPDLAQAGRAEFRNVTLEELLAHTGGLPTDVTRAPSWPSLRTAPGALRDRRRAFAGELLTLAPAGPRGVFAYSNAGYIVAGAMLEAVTGRLWEDLLREELLDPLGMTATGFGAPGAPGTPTEPWGHLRQGSGWAPVPPGPNADNPDVLGPAGTVHTTLGDYARFVMAHLAGARGTGGLVSAAGFARLHQPVPGTTSALGWGVGQRDWARGRVLQHAGSNTLWYAVVWIAPERDLAMFAVTNAAGIDGSIGAQGTDRAVQILLQRFQARYP